VGLHLRRGDFGDAPYWPAPNEWYLEYLRELWPTLEHPVLFIASDESEKVIEDFAEYSPVTCEDLGLSLDGAPFYPDFYLLSQCDILAISNSTFSFAAAMLNERATIFRRPDFKQKMLIAFDPWKSHPILHRELGKPISQSIREMQSGQL
jgi:hypothetical protein